MNAFELAEFAGKISYGPIKVSNGEVWLPCPFAPYTHDKKKDSRPSFSFKSGPPGSSVYFCFTCGKRGSNTLQFCKEMEYYDKYAVFNSGALRMAMQYDQESIGDKGFRLFQQLNTAIEKEKGLANIPAPTEVLQNTFNNAGLPEIILDVTVPLPPDAKTWLFGKGNALKDAEVCRELPKSAEEKYELKWDEDEKAVIFPIRDFSGRLVGTTKRSPYRKVGPKFKDRQDFAKTVFFYGESQLPKVDTIALVEGVFDVISLGSRGIPALAVMGTETLTSFKAARLKERGIKRVLIIPDGDEPGYKAAKKWLDTLLKEIDDVEIYPTAAGKDPDDLNSSDILARLHPEALPF